MQCMRRVSDYQGTLMEKLSSKEKLEAVNEIFNLLFQEQAEEEEVECQNCTEDETTQTCEEELLESFEMQHDLLMQLLEYKKAENPAQEVIPILATINSVIARNVKALDVNKTILSIDQLVALAQLSHVVKIPE